MKIVDQILIYKHLRWSTNVPSRRGRPSSSNIILHLPGPKGTAKNVKSPGEAWDLIFDKTVIEIITNHTNEEISRRTANIKNETYHKPTDILEIKAFLGLLYLAGVLKSSGLNTSELWSEAFGNGIFRATMSQCRFKFLAASLRFDDKNTRPQRRQADKFAHIRQIFDVYVANCKKYYSPYEYCTIDEQMLSFRGRCSFVVYNPMKPDKYGIKIVQINDARTSYMFNAIPYVGEIKDRLKNESVPTYYVRNLSEPIFNTNRNVTTDNWFTSIEAADMLKSNNLTLLGTIRKNKREIPPLFLKPQEEGMAVFAFSNEKTLVSYTPKKKKVVLMLSTMHHDDKIDLTTGKPDVIVMYNETKGGTDVFDKLCKSYTTCRKTARWPMRVFFGMLDGSGINAMILLNLATNSIKSSRKEFLKELGMYLITPFLKTRLDNVNLRKSLKIKIREILGVEESPITYNQSGVIVLPKNVRCAICKWRKDRKTKLACNSCRKPMCMEHRAASCIECWNKVTS